MKQQTPHIEHLKPLYEQIKDVHLSLLLSGLTVLVKDTANYLTANGIDGNTVEGFRLSYLDMLNDNRYYRERFGPYLYRSLNEAGLPDGFASAASKCDAKHLLPTEIPEEEWIRAPGWRFFLVYSDQRKSNILSGITLKDLEIAFCEGKDPYEKKGEDLCENEETDPYKPVAGVVQRLAGTDHLWNAFWYPVMLYMVLLLKKTDFMTLE